jgi:hypothetical protein
MYGNYQVGLAVPQIHLNDGNAATSMGWVSKPKELPLRLTHPYTDVPGL